MAGAAIVRLALLSMLAALLASPGAAQPAPTRPRAGGGMVAQRDEAFKMIDAYMVSNLQESLALSDEQFVKLLPLVKHLQSDRRDLVQRRQQALRDLRQLLKSGTATDAKVAAGLKDVKALEAEEPERIRKDAEAIDANLSPLQQAKFRVMQIEIEQKIRELMRQVRGQRRPGALEPEPPPP
jgi:hypothetical protein